MYWLRKLFRLIFFSAVSVGFLAIVLSCLIVFYLYIRITRDLPQIEKLSDYRPKAVTSIVAEDGDLLAEIYDERRYPLHFNEIPQVVKNAFLAAEDASFYSHPGIDMLSIVRAFWVNLRSHKAKQGASTITQQIVKSLLLTPERTYERKAKEAVLSYRLEKALTKDEIFSIYLNEIFLGSGAYGVKAAARVHFHKELSNISIAEAAFLAGLPQKPTLLSRPEHREEAIGRQHYALSQMSENKMITKEEYEAAKAEQIKIYPPEEQNVYAAPYYAGHAIKVLNELFEKRVLGDKAGSTSTNPGGLVVQTAADVKASEMAARALRHGVRDLDKRRGWRGAIGNIYDTHMRSGDETELSYIRVKSVGDLAFDAIYPAVIRKLDAKSGIAEIELGVFVGKVELAKAQWARTFLTKDDKRIGVRPESVLKLGDIIEVSLTEEAEAEKSKQTKNGLSFKLDQTPVVEGALVLSNALTGEVRAIIGGYDYKKSIFNRATQGLLQPGSAFKPFIYLAAIEHLNLAPNSIVPDEPISMIAGDGKIWAPQNFDEKFLGPITLRTALQRSRNVVSVYLLRRVGVERGIASARKLGITTPIGANMSIALGTAEVHLIELVRAYGAFAAEGWLADSLVIKSIKDRDGNLLYSQMPHQVKVIKDEDAFIMANMMKGVVERGTAQAVKVLNRPVAGKTGTTNDHMDAWFIGYTPEWVAGSWVGFDEKHPLGRPETGGRAAAPIFVELMQEFLADKPVIDFNIPDGVIPVPINLTTGTPVSPDTPGAFTEYFKLGTEPASEERSHTQSPQDYLSNDEF